MKFVVNKNIPLVRKAFESLGEVTELSSREFTAEKVRDADVIVVRSETKVDAALLDGSRIRFVGTATIGTDHIDLDYLRSKDIAFANAPGSNANSVKEYFTAALLHLALDHEFSLKGKTIGVVGVGNVGSRVAKAAASLGLEVLLNDPPLARQTGDKHFLSLEELMDCDIVTLHVPLTKDGPDPTYHLFDCDRMRKLKKGALFINTSRGAVVETAALKEAIGNGSLSNTVIDVWEHEPKIDVGLLSMVSIGTPHIAGYSLDGKVNAVSAVRAAICRHFSFDSDWDPDAYLDPPQVREVSIPTGSLQPEEVLNRAVSACYDISYDHAHLQQLTDVPESERQDYFMRLRSGYRVRREFPTLTVHLPHEHASMESVLSSLGFRCNVSNDKE